MTTPFAEWVQMTPAYVPDARGRSLRGVGAAFDQQKGTA
jgi:hypothetical protein